MARKLNLNIDQGATFSTDVTVTDNNNNLLNLSSYTANAAAKPWFTSDADDAVVFTIAMTNAANGVITMSMNSATTGTLERERYVYDMTITDSSGTVTRVIEGIILVDPQVTGLIDDE